MGVHPTSKFYETEGTECLGHSNWTICSALSPFCPKRFPIFSPSYWEANSYYPRRLIDGPTFATFLFQNTKPTATLLPCLLKCCIENKANCRQSRTEINEI